MDSEISVLFRSDFRRATPEELEELKKEQDIIDRRCQKERERLRDEAEARLYRERAIRDAENHPLVKFTNGVDKGLGIFGAFSVVMLKILLLCVALIGGGIILSNLLDKND